MATARPQGDSLEQRFPVPDLGEVSVGKQPSPFHQLRPQEFDEPLIDPATLPSPSDLFFGQAIVLDQPSGASTDPAPAVQEVSNPGSGSRFVFSDDVESPKVVEVRPRAQLPEKNPRQGAGLIDQSFHQSRDRDAHVIRQDRLEPSADGVAGVSYVTSNGINVVTRQSLDKDGFNHVEGSYRYPCSKNNNCGLNMMNRNCCRVAHSISNTLTIYGRYILNGNNIS